MINEHTCGFVWAKILFSVLVLNVLFINLLTIMPNSNRHSSCALVHRGQNLNKNWKVPLKETSKNLRNVLKNIYSIYLIITQWERFYHHNSKIKTQLRNISSLWHSRFPEQFPAPTVCSDIVKRGKTCDIHWLNFCVFFFICLN